MEPTRSQYTGLPATFRAALGPLPRTGRYQSSERTPNDRIIATAGPTALTEGRPLAPPFDDGDRAFAALRSDSQVPERMVREATPPERPPYHPATTTPGDQHESVAMVHTDGAPHGPQEIRQPTWLFPPCSPPPGPTR